jgi:hypothetical protein
MTDSAQASALRVYAGRFYKLLHQIGPIPAGIYRSEGCERNEFHFSIGRDRAIRFSLENLDSTLLSQVAFGVGKARATKQEEFIASYFSACSSRQSRDHEGPQARMPRLNYCSIRFAKQPQAMAALEAFVHARPESLV